MDLPGVRPSRSGLVVPVLLDREADMTSRTMPKKTMIDDNTVLQYQAVLEAYRGSRIRFDLALKELEKAQREKDQAGTVLNETTFLVEEHRILFEREWAKN